MSDNLSLIYAVGFILLIGLVFPFLLGFFVDVEGLSPSPLISPIVDVIAWDSSLNPFSWLGDSLQNYLVNSFLYLSLFPDFVIVIILILFILSVILTLIKLIPFV